MTDPAIVQRLEKLEKSNRRLKLLTAMCGVALASAVLIAADKAAQPIVTTSLRLVDAEGKTRAVLGCDQQGTFFALHDETGKMRASMVAQKIGPYINVLDAQDRTRAALSFDDRGPSLRMKDENGENTAILSADNLGGFVQMRDESGKTRTLATLSDVIAEAKKTEAK